MLFNYAFILMITSGSYFVSSIPQGLPTAGNSCNSDLDCSDNNDCTSDICLLGQCQHLPLHDTSCTGGTNVQRGRCYNGVCGCDPNDSENGTGFCLIISTCTSDGRCVCGSSTCSIGVGCTLAPGSDPLTGAICKNDGNENPSINVSQNPTLNVGNTGVPSNTSPTPSPLDSLLTDLPTSSTTNRPITDTTENPNTPDPTVTPSIDQVGDVQVMQDLRDTIDQGIAFEPQPTCTLDDSPYSDMIRQLHFLRNTCPILCIGDIGIIKDACDLLEGKGDFEILPKAVRGIGTSVTRFGNLRTFLGAKDKIDSFVESFVSLFPGGDEHAELIGHLTKYAVLVAFPETSLLGIAELACTSLDIMKDMGDINKCKCDGNDGVWMKIPNGQRCSLDLECVSTSCNGRSLSDGSMLCDDSAPAIIQSPANLANCQELS